MRAPFRKEFNGMMAVKVIDETIEAWLSSLRQRQGLSNFGIFSRASVSILKEEAYHDVHVNPSNKL